MKYVFSCLKRYKKEAVLAPLFKLAEAGLELVVPLAVGAITKNGVGAGDGSYILWGCLFLVGLGAVGLVFSLVAQYFAARAAVGVSGTLREKLFVKLQSYSYSLIDRTGKATMVNRMTSDALQVQTGVNMTLRLLLRSPFVVFGATAMAFTVDAHAALVFIVLIPLLAVVVYSVMAACMPLYRRVQERLDRVYSTTRENLSGVRVIRAFCKEEDERKSFLWQNGALRSAEKRVGRIASLTAPLTFALVNVALIFLLWIAAGRVSSGAIVQSDVLSLTLYLSMILVELIKLANLIVTITKAAASSKRIGQALEEKGEASVVRAGNDEKALKGAGEEYAVQFDGVSFSYFGGAPALKGIDLCVKHGETVGILGGTGAGKTTLMNLIPRFYEATEGSVRVYGRDVLQIPVEELRKLVGVAAQKSVLFQGTIRSNLLWGKGDATDEELLSAIACAQAQDVLDAKGGLDGEVQKEGKNLSGGQRQRLSLARALVRKPKILILDDTSSALDYATDARLRRAIATLGGTVFIVSQRVFSVMNSDKIVVLDDGQIAGMGTHDALMRDCAVYREIYKTQFREGV